MFNSLTARVKLPLSLLGLATAVVLSSTAPALADHPEDQTSPVIPDAPTATETWQHPSNITENHIDQQVYNQLRGLLPADRFSNEVSARHALNNPGMALFRDGRVQAFYAANQGILIADGSRAALTDPESRRWLGSVTPVRTGNFLALPPLPPAKKAGLFQLGALAHIGHYLLVNSNVPEIQPVAQNVAKELAAITPATNVPEITSGFSGATAYNNDKGGYSDTVKNWDAAVQRLDKYVAENYGDEGLWYYALGGDSAGMWWLYQGQDQWSTPVYMGLLNLLSTHQPVLVDADGHQEGIDVTPHNRAMTQVVALINYSPDELSTYYVPDHSAKLLGFYFPTANGQWTNQNKSYPKR